jgi:hypothetical protein
MPSGSVSWHKDGNILEVVQSCNPITYPRIPLVLQSMPTSFDIHIKAHDGDGSIWNLLIFLEFLESLKEFFFKFIVQEFLGSCLNDWYLVNLVFFFFLSASTLSDLGGTVSFSFVLLVRSAGPTNTCIAFLFALPM